MSPRLALLLSGIAAAALHGAGARAGETPAAATNTAGDAGPAVYAKWCAPCHDPGITHPGTHALMGKYAGSRPAVLLERTDLEPAFVRYMVRHGFSVMPPFRKTEISDAELEALARWLSAGPAGRAPR
ncbi:MAG: cytochrome c [Steroidobacteraceae bacterium]